MYRKRNFYQDQLLPREPGRLCRGVSVLFLCSVLVVLASCSLRLDNEELLNRASAALDQHELRAAVIDLKAILQADPEHGEARLLLGRTYLKVADPLAAEKELRRALELGIARSRVVIPLAESLLAQEAFDRVLEEAVESESMPEGGAAKLRLIRGDAELSLGRPTAAREQYVAVLESEPENGIAYLGLASVAATESNVEQVSQYLDRAIEVAPDLPIVWLARGEFSMSLRDPVAAEESLRRALALADGPADVRVRQDALAGLTDVYLVKEDIEAATESLGELKLIAPNTILARYSEARVAFAKGELDSAVQLLQGILKDLPDFRKAHFLFGAVSRAKGNLAQAEMYLASVVTSWPENEQARRMLADVRFRQSKFADAGEALEPLLTADDADDQLLAVAGVVMMRAGEGDAGLELFERSVAADPENLARKLDLAALYLAANQVDMATSLLESLEDSGADETRRRILTLLSTERGGDRAAAVQMAKGMIDQSPDNVSLLIVAGGLFERAGDITTASRVLEQALKLDANRIAAILSLGRIDASTGKLVRARSWYRRALQLEPDNAQIMMGLSTLATGSGDIATAVSWLEKARDSSPTAVMPRVRLIEHYLSQNRAKDAGVVAQEAVRINDSDARTHNILGVTRMAQGDFVAASSSFADAVRLAPEVPAYRLNHARAELQRGNEEGAGKMMRENYDRYPDYVAAAMQLAAFHLGQRRYAMAMEVADRLQAEPSNRVAGLALAAEVLAAQSRFAEAAALYDQALEIDSERKLASRAVQLRKRASDADPFEPLSEYVQRNRSDMKARMSLAEALLADGKSARAISQYEAVLAGDSENLVALNNLAWVLVGNGDPRARELAEIAYSLSPDNPSIVDTYGYVLLSLGEAGRAVEVLRSAADTMPENESIRTRLDEAQRLLAAQE